MKFSELLLFWLGMVLGTVVFKMVVEVGALHRLWPHVFDAPASTCARGDGHPDDWQDIWPELAESEAQQPPALTHQAPTAINSEAREAAHV